MQNQAEFQYSLYPKEEDVTVRFYSAEAMQIYSKLTQLLSEWAVRSAGVSKNNSVRKKKSRSYTSYFFKNGKGKLSQVELNVSVTNNSKHVHMNSA